jgi:hypothetical protein
MNDNTILRIKVPAHLYESVKEQLTVSKAPKEMSHGLLQKMLDDLLAKYGNTEQMKSNILIALRAKINDMLNNMHPQLKTKFKEGRR